MSYNYNKLLEPIKINGMILKNRISFSPMGTFTPMQDGTDSEEGMRYYEERAKGGIGLINTGAMFLNSALAQGSPTIALDNINAIPKTTVMVERVHRWGAKICLQVSPGTGRNTVLGDQAIKFGQVPISSSPNPSFYDPNVICREMTLEEIDQMMEDWKTAATFAQRCGFDAIQIHAHAGYLIDQFMSSVWNHRTDKYGGSFENRCRFALEIVQAIRSVVGPNFPITYRISLDHRFNGGRTLEESMKVLDVLDKCGIDAFDIDAGAYESQDYIFPTRYVGDACMAYVCEEARKHLTHPIINTGTHTMETAVELLESGNADIIQFGRQSIADPYFPKKLAEGRREDIRPCMVCNEECIGRIFCRLTQLSCAVNPAAGLEDYMEVTKLKTSKNVVVIGAGPGGLEAARCAAERGAAVTLYEKNGYIGGTFIDIATGGFKGRMRDLVEWYRVQLQKLGVKIVLNTEVGAEDPVLAGADYIFVATGSAAICPKLPGMDDPRVIGVTESHKQGVPAGKRVVICGGGLSACDTALEIAQADPDRDITILEMKPQIGGDIMPINAISIFRMFDEYGIHQMANATVCEITAEGVKVSTPEGDKVIPADVIISAFGQKPANALGEAIQWAYPTKTTVIGDCVKPGKAGTAIREGFYAAMAMQD
ncbi:MAG: NAD(P)/FAD-dependent oxidoreductase [Lachnospiraceae bacterium]|nr:NAD(P)/FAD-dependent oxidoreductase [Lachnospiraceae bacterium]